jgi:pilus assembly protein CpaE
VTDALAGRASDWRLFWVSQPEQAPTRSEGLQPQIILLDQDLTDADLGLLVQRLAFGSPQAAILLLSSGATPSLEAPLPAGVHGYLSKPVTPDGLIPAVGQALVRSGQTDEGPTDAQSGNLIIVCSVSGGVGCTTTAGNSAKELARLTGEPVALVDADYSDPAVDRMFGVVSSGTLTDLARRSGRADIERSPFFVAHESGVRVLTAPPSGRKRRPLSRSQATAACSALRRAFRWSVVDLGVPHDEMGYAFLDAADLIVLMVAPELTSLRDTRLFLDQLYARGYALSKVWVVANSVGMSGAMQVDELQRWLGVRVNYGIPYLGTLAAGGHAAIAGATDEITTVYGGLAQAIANERGGQIRTPASAGGMVGAPVLAAAGGAAAAEPALRASRGRPPSSALPRSRRFALYGGFVVFLAILAAGAALLVSLREDAGLMAWSRTPSAPTLTADGQPAEPGVVVAPASTQVLEPTEPSPTPMPTATATTPPSPTVTAAPTMTPSPEPTATETPTVTPTETASPTLPPPTARPPTAQPPTVRPPTATRRVQPTARPTERRAAPSAPVPSFPAPEQSVDGIVTFAWQPAGELPPGTAYEVVWWNTGEDPAAARGIAPPTTETSLAANLDVLYNNGQFVSNRINWAPIVVETSPYRRLTQPGGAGSSVLIYAPASGGGEPPVPRP